MSSSIDREEELVSLSLLPEDTGKSDVLPESLGLPLRLIRKEKKCNAEKGKKKRKLSESEQVSHSLTAFHAYVFCFQTCYRLAFPFLFTRVLNVLFDYSQVSKKKKKKSKTDGNDSGVEVYFREEDDDDEDKKPQADSVKVPFCFFFTQ